MDFKQLKYLINSDLYRLNYTPSTKNILKAIFFNYSFKYVCAVLRYVNVLLCILNKLP